MGALCLAFIEPLSYHFFTPNATPFSNRTDNVAILPMQHASAQGSRLVTVALGPRRLGGKDAVK